MFIPSAKGDSNLPDIALEHALHDGDLTFTLRMPKEMICGPSEFCHARNIPGRAMAQLVNLATVNYLLWGLQIGRSSPDTRNNRWQNFFLRLTQGSLHFQKKIETEEEVWNFIQMFLRPFGVMVGSDMQGGQHEGGENRVATYPVDYVGSFLIDGKCRKLNNLWRHQNIAAGDDVVLVLKKTTERERSLVHVLTSGSRAFREERTYSNTDWFYLAPAIAKHSIHESPYIHIGRSQGMYSAYNAGMGMGRCPWDARASILGQGIQVTFEPCCYTPDYMQYSSLTTSGNDSPVTAKPKPKSTPTVPAPTSTTSTDASEAVQNVQTTSSSATTDQPKTKKSKKTRQIPDATLSFAVPEVSNEYEPEA